MENHKVFYISIAAFAALFGTFIGANWDKVPDAFKGSRVDVEVVGVSAFGPRTPHLQTNVFYRGELVSSVSDPIEKVCDSLVTARKQQGKQVIQLLKSSF